MSEKQVKSAKTLFQKDFIIIILLWLALVLIKAFDKDNYHLHFYELVITWNKVLMLIFVNYFVFPLYYSNYRPWRFISMLVICTFLFGYVEEFLIEPYLDFDPLSHPIASPVSVFIGYALPLTSFLLLKFFFHFSNREQLITKLEKEKSDSQLKFLKSQISPHILFNNLNNIYSLSEHEDKRASKAILKLSHLMRYVIYESSNKHVLLSRELENLEAYLELQQIQLEGRGKIIYNNKINAEGYTIAPLLLLPFVENCFKHSMCNILKDIVIHIEISLANNILHFYCSNPTSEEGKAKDEGFSGIGLENTKQRLELGYYNRYDLKISNTDSLFKVDLRLNLL
ncbi:MAG: sensor histidine kinase [Bacteroidota bacterium]